MKEKMEQKKCRKIMFQGTSSSAGKSLMTTGFCRILSDLGDKVAPFKSQNMSRNFHLLPDGDYMSTAQAVQAEAARRAPSVRMNPILLMPTSDTGSMIFLNGKPFARKSAREYFKMKRSLLPLIREAWDALASDCDSIVIEGAGSPAEINFQTTDIVNMGIADLVDAPVVLVADIDRGGMFASLYGTYLLLNPEHRQRVKGYIINKFRGDKTLLEPGIVQLEQRMPIPCLGVMPMIPDLMIEEEDSLVEGMHEKRHSHKESREKEYDRLAAFMRAHLDIPAILALMV